MIFDATLGSQIHGLLTGATTAEPELAEAVEPLRHGGHRIRAG